MSWRLKSKSDPIGESSCHRPPGKFKVEPGLLDHDDYETSVKRSERPEERAARLEGEKFEADHRRRKDLLHTWAGIVFVGLFLIFGLISMAFGTVEQNARVLPFVTALVSGFLGLQAGQKLAEQAANSGRK